MILLNSGQDFFVISWQLYAKESTSKQNKIINFPFHEILTKTI